MVNSEKQQSRNDQEKYDVDRLDQFSDGDSINDASSSSVSIGSSSSSLTERLTEILVEDSDGDLLLQRSDREDNVLQWLLALDMQVMGACRVDERLKPLLKMSVSSGAAEDRLLAHLSQHFEPAEIGMLARCLCIPLVSIRVGKINKQGTILCPTDRRGNLNLTILPTSDLRISFIGDDGCTERLATFSSDSESSTAEIEGISADKSGRSFLIKRHGEISYFWCSEKSKLLGDESLRKMKDFLQRKPSLAEITGISESRLDCFAIHLRAYLKALSVSNTQAGPMPSETSSLDSSLDSVGLHAHSSITSVKSSCSRLPGSQGLKSSSLHQGSLSPRLNSFKEGTPRSLLALRCVAREKLKRHGDSYLSCIDNLMSPSASSSELPSSNPSERDKLPEAIANCLFPPVSSVESVGRSADPSSLLLPPIQVSSLGSPLFSPYYCWCPPVAAPLPYTGSWSQLPVSSTESFSLPSLSSLLSPANSASLLPSIPPLNVAEFPSIDFPPLMPDPLVRSQLALPSSQQIPTFTPLMCDPIVHIPIIDVCSSGQGYLVSAGPAISTIPQLYPNLVGPLIPEAESMVEKGARETLRLLIGGSSNQPNSLMDVFPSVIMNGGEKTSIFAAGSRGLYTGTKDVPCMSNTLAAMGLGQLHEGSAGGNAIKRCIFPNDHMDMSEDSGGSGRTNLNDGQSNVRDERTD